ncbi:MAG: NigD-like protein [Phocaeicola sp.]
MKPLSCFYLIITISLLLIGCKEKEYIYPTLTTEFCGLKTNASGVGHYLVTDDDKQLWIENQSGVSGLKSDTTYRVVSRYAPANDSPNPTAVKLYGIANVIAPIPIKERQFQQFHTDAVELQSIWKKGDYLNLVVRVKMKEKVHIFHFIENKLEEIDGKRTLYLTLYHDRKNDIEAFYQTTYLSVPLWSYSNRLQEGDTIVFQLNTYKEGMISRTFIY